MLTVDQALLQDPMRLAAVARLRPVMGSRPGLLNAVAAVAARSLAAPLAVLSLVGDGEEDIYGSYDPDGVLAGAGVTPSTYSVGRYVLGADRWVSSQGMPAERGSGIPGVREFIGVALKDGEHRPVGCLAVLDMESRQWSAEQAALLMKTARILGPDLLAGIAPPGGGTDQTVTTAPPIPGADGRRLGAVAITHEGAAMRRAEQFRQCRLAVARTLAASHSPPEAASGVLRVVAVTLRWPYAELWLIDDATDGLDSIGRWSAPGLNAAELAGHAVAKGVGVTGRCWATGDPIWVRDITEDADSTTPEPHPRIEACRRLGFRTVLAVPVRDGDTMLGVLTCYSDAPEQQEDLLTVLLDGVAAQFGVFVASRRAAELDRHLDLVGLDALHLGLTVRPVDLVGLIGAATAAARPAASDHGVTLTGDLPAGLTVTADPGRLRQALDELLSNAIGCSRPGGNVHVHLHAEAGMAELEITDPGIGILTAAGGSTVRHQGTAGSGLGLSLTRTIVGLHRGTLTLSGRESAGTTVRVRLPLRPDPQARTSIGDQPGPASGQARRG